MSKRKPSIAVVGAGRGGLAAAATLRRIGIDVQIYEQAGRFARIGAGIQMMPNSMNVLRGIGVEDWNAPLPDSTPVARQPQAAEGTER